jgi:hypothetical protein
MNGSYLRSAKMILVGSIIGGLLAWLIRPPLIGLTLGIVIGLKIGAITKWTDGVRHGAIIGFIVGASIAPFASVVNGIMIVDLISFGIFGAVFGTAVGGIVGKFFNSEKSWLW